jgi:hypothetical protein
MPTVERVVRADEPHGEAQPLDVPPAGLNDQELTLAVIGFTSGVGRRGTTQHRPHRRVGVVVRGITGRLAHNPDLQPALGLHHDLLAAIETLFARVILIKPATLAEADSNNYRHIGKAISGAKV